MLDLTDLYKEIVEAEEATSEEAPAQTTRQKLRTKIIINPPLKEEAAELKALAIKLLALRKSE